MTLQELRDARAKAIADARALLYQEDGEARAEVSDDDKSKADQLMDAADELKAQIDAAETDEARSARLADAADSLDAPEDRSTRPVEPTDKPKTREREKPWVTAPVPGEIRGFGSGNDAAENAYKSGMWLRAAFGNGSAYQWCRDNGVDTRALAGGVNDKGGVLVPTELETAIINLRETRGVFRREAQVVNMGSDTRDVPRRTGGVTAYPLGENAEITASDPAFDAISLVARKWGVLVKMSSELDEDSVIDLSSFVAAEIGYAFADKEDECGFNGDGTSTYHGCYGAMVKSVDGNHAGTVYDAISGNTYFSVLDLADFEAMVGKLPQYAEANAKWYISKAGWAASMARLADVAGGNTSANIAAGSGLSFLGYPVVISQVLFKTLTASTSTAHLLFGDLRQAATLGSRRGIRIRPLMERYAEYDQIGIQATTRFDINVHELGDASTAGSLIVLKTPGS